MPKPPPPSISENNRRIFSQSSGSTSAYSRHVQAAQAYLTYYNGEVPTAAPARNERDILEAHHRFLRDAEEDEINAEDEERKLARQYYEKLFKEFPVVELARWKERKIAMRWRTKDEVLKGTGEFSCANLSCPDRGIIHEDPEDDYETSNRDRVSGKKKEGLRGFELNFEYVEEGKIKNALVTVRVCGSCAKKLRHTQKKEESTQEPTKERSRSMSRSRERRRERDKARRTRKEEDKSEGRRKEENSEKRREKRHRRRRDREDDSDGEDKHSGRQHRGSRSQSPRRHSGEPGYRSRRAS